MLDVAKSACLPYKTKKRKPRKATKGATERSYTIQGARVGNHENYYKRVRNEAVKR